MRFAFAAVLALGTTVHNSDAFLSPTFKPTTAEILMKQNNAGALSASTDDESLEDGDKSGSRFQEMLRLAKEQQGSNQQMGVGGKPIDNPFLNPKPAAPSNPDDLSVEDQARMFREMMAGNQPPPQAPRRVMADPGEARPVGRNNDADKIANTSDLYFAQLKRDSTVRTISRIQGNEEVSEAVFGDDGIQELEDLLLSNPYLKGRQEEERKLLDNVPTELISPYFKSDEMEEAERTSAGVSYKQKLMERRKKKSDGQSDPAPAPKEEVAEAVEPPTPPEPEPEPEPELEPEPVVAQVSIPPPVQPEPEQESVVPQATSTPPLPTPQQQQPPPPAPVVEIPQSVTVTSSDDTRTQNLRTLMGLILKHRGGPSFGKGRLKGQDVDLFAGLIKEITNMLRDEVSSAAVVESPAVVEAVPVPVPAAPVQAVETPVAASASAKPANIDSTIACIEGAITMYNNSPPAIRESVLGVLRAALVAAVDTCDVALASQPAPPVAASPDASMEGMVACIEGAVTMYKNSPPALKESVMATLRMALMSAVATCDVIISGGQVAPPAAAVETPPAVQAPPAVQPVAPVETVSTQVAPPPAPVELDRNSIALEKLYETVQSASGDGKLGLRSDISPDEASALVDELVGMRKILMEELEAGIPELGAPELGKESPKPKEKVVSETSTASKYQQMLAKARAEKKKS